MNSANDMIPNTKVCYHANQLTRTINKIIMLTIKVQNCEQFKIQEREQLVELGKRHYHHGKNILKYLRIVSFIV